MSPYGRQHNKGKHFNCREMIITTVQGSYQPNFCYSALFSRIISEWELVFPFSLVFIAHFFCCSHEKALFSLRLIDILKYIYQNIIFCSKKTLLLQLWNSAAGHFRLLPMVCFLIAIITAKRAKSKAMNVSVM